MQKLLFVYGLNSGAFTGIMGAFHKWIRPQTYSCSLCKLTHNAFFEKKKWKHFKANLPLEVDFLYRDEYQRMYASKFGLKLDFPVVLLVDQMEMQVFITTEELKEMSDVSVLKATIQERLPENNS